MRARKPYFPKRDSGQGVGKDARGGTPRGWRTVASEFNLK